jgi:hypothetical protein
MSSQTRAFPLPTIAEDTLHYSLHLPAHLEPSSTALLITEHVHSLLPSPWLWNKDAWELKIAPESPRRVQKGIGGQLEGRMRVGDAVDDEWLVVWLLREVSRKWKDIVIRYVHGSPKKGPMPLSQHSEGWCVGWRADP